MSLWLERLYKLTHYYNMLLEANQHRLARQGQEGSKGSHLLVRKFMAWLGFCLSTWGNQLQKRYGKDFSLVNPILSSDRNANHEWMKSGADNAKRL